MKVIPCKIIRVPDDLASVTSYKPADEVNPSEVGMNQEEVQAIWAGVEDLYRSGIHPAISFCLRRQGKVVLKRAIGHARGMVPMIPQIQKRFWQRLTHHYVFFPSPRQLPPCSSTYWMSAVKSISWTLWVTTFRSLLPPARKILPFTTSFPTAEVSPFLAQHRPGNNFQSR